MLATLFAIVINSEPADIEIGADLTLVGSLGDKRLKLAVVAQVRPVWAFIDCVLFCVAYGATCDIALCAVRPDTVYEQVTLFGKRRS